MDALFFTSLLYFYWPFIIGGILLLAAVVRQDAFEWVLPEKKAKRPVKRDRTTILLTIAGILFLALYPLNNYLRTAHAGSQLKTSSLGILKTAPFTLYSLGDHPARTMSAQYRSIDEITVGPVPGKAYFEEFYRSTDDNVQVYEYANPTSKPEQECNADIIADMAGILSTTDPEKIACQLLDNNNGKPIYGYNTNGGSQPDVMLSNYGNTRIVMQFMSQTLTVQQHIKLFQQLKQADPGKIRYLNPD